MCGGSICSRRGAPPATARGREAERGPAAGVSVRVLTRAATYAALYAVLTLVPGLNSLAYGQVQFRLSEGLMAFACFDVAAVPGLAVGAALANVASPMGITDVLFGATLTLIAAAVMCAVGPRPWALATPVVVNGLGVGLELRLLLGLPLWPSVGFVALGESVVMLTLGAVMYSLASRYGTMLGLSRPGGHEGRRP
jgi:uncharacterized membrane protein